MVFSHPISLSLNAVTKRYNRAPIFSPVSFEISAGNILAITGSNGSGKSTLLKIIAGITAPSKGTCIWEKDNKLVDARELQKMMGFVSPYLELYSELTAREHVQFIAELKETKISVDVASEELVSYGLDKDVVNSERTVKQYSSGMQQRARLAMAFINDPKVLLLDEPSSNLDEAGIQSLFNKITDTASNGSLVIIATNDERERNLASKEVRLEPFKK